jgi:hypothetical protein
MQAPPVAFESALLNRPQVPGLGPAGPLTLYDPLAGGYFVPISPPPLPEGVCAPVKKKGSIASEAEGDTIARKKKPGPCGTGGTETVPEPGTWFLFASGLTAIFWRARRKLLRVRG